jgi:hypothetical protein
MSTGPARTAAVVKTAANARRKTKMKRETITFDQNDRIVGTRPEHIHRPSDPKAKIKEWACNSPYCEDLTNLHPTEGGPEPIVQGREPWRGGNR